MIHDIALDDLLFLDIETVPQCSGYHELSPEFRRLWDKKAATLGDKTPEEFYERAGIYAEFGKIICISVGVVSDKNGQRSIRLKSYAGHDEAALLRDFAAMLGSHSANRRNLALCAHNGKEFDFPYISRRMLVHGIRVPAVIDTRMMKPWDIRHLDTMELWRFGDYKHYTSLQLLTCLFDIPTPKDDIDGSQVAGVYWGENNLPRIVEYCQKDVVAVVQLFLRYRGEPLVDPASISIS